MRNLEKYAIDLMEELKDMDRITPPYLMRKTQMTFEACEKLAHMIKKMRESEKLT